MNKLEEAESKLKFADYLLQRENFSEYASGIAHHLLEAANKAVTVIFNLDGTSINHLIINKRLSSGTQEEKDFSGVYLALWKLAANPKPTKEEITRMMARVRTFTQYVKAKRESA
ncbi:MAG: hypothetical protein AABX75_03190 [Nanoarchaeota archaeon]